MNRLPGQPDASASDGDRMPAELAELRRRAPDGFAARVMARLPAEPDRGWAGRWRRLWPEDGHWFLPALAGACATLALIGLTSMPLRSVTDGRMTVRFELHAPDAGRVELVGDFTAWQPGRIRLEGPDASGHWTADIRLPEGRHEYIFLVDGRQWVADPAAAVHRPDGFGRENAVVDL